jgi:hypothetical protein
MQSPPQSRFSQRIAAAYLLLLLLAVPWYWPADSRALLFGVPAWVAVSILVSFVVSVFTAWVLLRHRWPGENGPG